MLESPSSSSSSIIATNYLPIEQPTPLTTSTEINELKTTTTNYIEIGCKENDEKFKSDFYQNEQNFHQQQQQPQNDQREPTAYKKLVSLSLSRFLSPKFFFFNYLFSKNFSAFHHLLKMKHKMMAMRQVAVMS